MASDLTVIVLAAGGGTRMKSKTIKVLHRVGGPQHGRPRAGRRPGRSSPPRSSRSSATSATRSARTSRRWCPTSLLAVQEEQHGTGHAVRIAVEARRRRRHRARCWWRTATPRCSRREPARLRAEHEAAQRAVSILSGVVADPFGYGRVRPQRRGRRRGDRRGEGRHRRAARDPRDQLRDPRLRRGVPRRRAAAARQRQRQGRVLPHRHRRPRPRGRAAPSARYPIDDVMQTEGANDRVQLAAARPRAEPSGSSTRWMRDGRHRDGPRHDLDRRRRGARARRDAAARHPAARRDRRRGGRRDRPGHHAQGLRDRRRRPGRPHPRRARGDRRRRERRPVRLPAARHRRSGAGGKIGTFVETKNAQIGDGAKVPHLSYVGDAEIGEGTNIGAGTIFANYDGVDEAPHRSSARRAKTGANNTFVAPVTIGDGAGDRRRHRRTPRRAAGRPRGLRRAAAQPRRAGRSPSAPGPPRRTRRRRRSTARGTSRTDTCPDQPGAPNA